MATPKGNQKGNNSFVPDGFDDLAEAAKKGFPTSWIPQEAGDSIGGFLVRMEMAGTEYGPAPVAVLNVAGTERSVWLLSSALVSGFQRLRPAPGDRVFVTYLGKQKVKNKTVGRKDTYQNFRVVGEQVNGSFDWDAISLSGDAENPVDDGMVI